MADAREVMRVEGLKKYYDVEKGFLKRKAGLLKAVDDVSFSVFQGETLGMVGESGCGKSTVGKSILRAHDLTGGKVICDFGGKQIDVSSLSPLELRNNGFRQHTQMIFQDPNSSLNPRMTVLDIISEPLRYSSNMSNDEIEARVIELMERVGLDRKYLKRYPHAFSGGQRQRISIARALTTSPRFIVADEPTSALDVSIQAQILNLMVELQRERGLSYLFVSHNLGVIRHVSDRVVVMYLGKMVELAESDALFETPKHPYTEALMKSIPIADPNIKSGLESAQGDVGNPLDPPSGCHFHPRCAYACDVCAKETPTLKEVNPGHFVACHRAEELTLEPIKNRTLSREAVHV